MRSSARTLRRHLGSNVVAYLALFISMTGTASAAAVVWTGANIADGSLTGADVAAGSLTGDDIADGSLTSADGSIGGSGGAREAHIINDAHGSSLTRSYSTGPFGPPSCPQDAWEFDSGECGATGPTRWAVYNSFDVDASRYPTGATISLTGILSVDSANTTYCIRLYDVTAGVVLTGTEACITSAASTAPYPCPGAANSGPAALDRVSSGAVALPSGSHRYIMQSYLGGAGQIFDTGACGYPYGTFIQASGSPNDTQIVIAW